MMMRGKMEPSPAVAVQRAIAGLADVSHLPRLAVTAGPTCEDIDAIRFIANRSSGRVGIEIAAAAAARQWPVLLILGPTHLLPPAGVKCTRVRSAAEMLAAVSAAFEWCTALIMAAAVADYTPAEPFAGKIKKSEAEIFLRLRRTLDILAELSRHPERSRKIVIGFSLAPDLDLAEGRRKLAAKRLDAIVVNTAASFGEDTIEAHFIAADNTEKAWGCISKGELANYLLHWLAQRLSAAPHK